MTQNGKSAESQEDKTFKDKTEKLISEIREKGKHLLTEGLEGAKDVFAEKKKTMKLKAGELQDKSIDEISDDVKVFVRRKPFQSLAMALGVGVLLGFLIKSDD